MGIDKGDFTEEELIQICTEFNQEHVEMIKWLKDNYPKVLRHYFDEHGLKGKDVLFLGEQNK